MAGVLRGDVEHLISLFAGLCSVSKRCQSRTRFWKSVTVVCHTSWSGKKKYGCRNVEFLGRSLNALPGASCPGGTPALAGAAVLMGTVVLAGTVVK